MTIDLKTALVLASIAAGAGCGEGRPGPLPGAGQTTDAPLRAAGADLIDRFRAGDALLDAVFREADGLGPLYIRDEARDFTHKLCARLVADARVLVAEFAGQALDPEIAYRCVIASMNEQIEKVNLVATGEDETRYSRHTLADLRSDVTGAKAAHEAFRAWLTAGPVGPDVDARMEAAFQRLIDACDAISGDAVPDPPGGWSAANPSASDLQTPYGQLFQAARAETDARRSDSLVGAMTGSLSARPAATAVIRGLRNE